MSAPVDLDALEKLLAEATPAPWEADADKPWGAWAVLSPDGRLFHLRFPEVQSRGSMAGGEDARLIAALRNAAPALLAELRAARAVVEAVRLDPAAPGQWRIPPALRAYDAATKGAPDAAR